MESIDPFISLTRQLSKRDFVAHVHGYMFFKTPLCRPQVGPMEYETAMFRSDDPAIEISTLPAWAVAAIRKRPGNPFPDRISVGRALNCDVVLRLSFVSKLHAHLLIEDGQVRALVDNNSTNGTKINGTPLIPGKATRVESDDLVSFGELDLTLLSPNDLYDRLIARR